MTLHYYALRHSTTGDTINTISNRYGTREEMERQFHLYCASAATNADNHTTDAVEWGTIEGGKLDRKEWIRDAQPESEPEQPEEAAEE